MTTPKIFAVAVLTQLLLSCSVLAQGIIPPGGGTNGGTVGGGNGDLVQPNYGTNLWMQLTNVNFEAGTASFVLHNTTNNLVYEIWCRSNFVTSPWIPLQFIYPAGGTNTTTPISVGIVGYWWEDSNPGWYPELPNMFFFVNGGTGVPGIEIIPSPNTTVNHPSSPNDMSQNVTKALYYGTGTPSNLLFQVLGDAVYGVDYTLQGMTYSNGIAVLTISSGSSSPADFIVEPLYTTNATFNSVSVTLAMLPSYFANLGRSATSVTINPQIIPFTVVTNLSSLFYEDGIAYNPVQNGLVMTVNDPSGETNNFILIQTNALGSMNISDWSSVAGAPNEVEVTIAQTTTNGFVQGDMYFGDYFADGSAIDKLSADGTQWTPDWCSLTNAAGVVGLYIDQTGVFGGNLIATTDDGGVYSIGTDTNGNALPTLLTNIPSVTGLGGAITIPNDLAKWGPWAGKILTGDPDSEILYSIDTNGVVTSYQTTNYLDGVAFECFALIPPNQNLYFIDAINANLDEISATNLAPYVGDLAISSTATSQPFPGFPDYSPLADIFIVRWNATNSDFEVRSIPGSPSSIYEDLTFAPIDLLSQ